MKANKKMVQEHVQNISGKKVTLRDLSNIRARGADKAGNTRNDLNKLYNMLKEKPGKLCEIEN